MAKKNRQEGTSSIETRSFQKGMIKDVNESLMPEGAYLHARNAVSNSKAGDLGVIGNEPSNDFCVSAPYTVIGAVHLYADIWTIFSTDDTNSEIGRFDEGLCEYTTIANDPCLGFKKTNPIIGEAKETFECTWKVYFSDGLNPDRVIDTDKPAFIQDCQTVDDCLICEDTTELDCDKLRMARLTTPPCLTIAQGPNGGELSNGTYQAVIAYTENEQRVSDYSIPSNLVSLFDHRNINGSIDITIESIDDTYDEFELVVIGFVNNQLVARRMGIYSTRQKRISIDKIDPAANIAVPLQFIPIDRPSYEKSEGIYRNGDFLIRVAPTTRFSFNYQPLANQIRTKWVSTEYPADYYRKAGKNPSYLRDEVYAFFIRWIYDTNDKSESYHIPGRGPIGNETNVVPSPAYGTGFQFEETNTATILVAGTLGTTDDGGNIVAKGLMGYWESSEIYPDDKPDVWASLCGKPIRHHKMPDQGIEPHYNVGNGNIRVLGVEFDNIPFPVDGNNVAIPGIIGYEILRGTREGNKSVVAKGLINNLAAYQRENGQLAYYQNYPYNDLRTDPFLSTSELNSDIPNGTVTDYPSIQPGMLGGGNYRADSFTFHSPDTQFKHPFLSAKEIKIYETAYGDVDGVFEEPYKHPEHKILTDFSFLLSALIGFGVASLTMRGEQKTTVERPNIPDTAWAVAGATIGGNVPYLTALTPLFTTAKGTIATADGIEIVGGTNLLTALIGLSGDTSVSNAAVKAATNAISALPGVTGGTTTTYDSSGGAGLHPALRVLSSLPTFLGYWSESTDVFIKVIKAFSQARQHALAYQSHCFYDNRSPLYYNQKAGIVDASYIGDRLQEFGGIQINNLYRNACVGLIANRSLSVPSGTIKDTSRITFTNAWGALAAEDKVGLDNPNPGRSSAHYVGLKQRLRNQYGQMDGILQLPTGCMQEYIIDPANPGGATSGVIFGGDTYIGRYTEKNTFFYFNDWMFDLPDDFEYDYRLRKMLPYPTYWMDTRDFQVNDFLTGIFSQLTGAAGVSALPSGRHNFDTPGIPTGGGLLSGISLQLMVKDAWMYLFNSGVRDFYVESEVNVEYRDWGESEEERHYDPYNNTSLIDLFRTDRLKAGNFYKYDYSLSASRYYQGFPSWGRMQYRNYDPEVAETCYTFYPNRLIYSLPQNTEQRYDNWLAYLVNNYKDFTSRVTAIKSIGKNGAMMLFETEAPLMFQGVDTLQTTSGTKITLGDGGLFNQALQNLVNTDESYEYGSCQDRLSVINTPAGLFWISQNQGKIFNYTGSLEDIAQQGLKWWFDEFLPYKILEDFPNFELTDNTVIGVGCQSIYDNSDGEVYFSKRDFKLRPEFVGRVTYMSEDNFNLGAARFKLGDPRYFDDASWTVSYDAKAKGWVSFHDWHPNFVLPSKNNFLTIKNASIWSHGGRTDSFCNFYGDDYPFEVELVTPTGQNVNTLKSIEYLMEVFQWDADGVDRNHVLDFNFDRAVLYNTEQISGELRLNLMPKNNAPAMLNFPQVNPSSIDILYSKVEQKYRFNQFWDITDDRGEFTNARRMMWETEPNGYIKSINPLYVNYNKPVTQRKKFRHYQSNLWLRRRVSGVHNMQLKLINSKNQYSAR